MSHSCHFQQNAAGASWAQAELAVCEEGEGCRAPPLHPMRWLEESSSKAETQQAAVPQTESYKWGL